MVAPVVVGAGISALGGIVGGKSASKNAKKAAELQLQAQREQMAQQQAQFALTQQNLAPYMQAGNSALGAQQTLLGLNGGAQQQAAYDLLKASPAFTSLYGTGQDTILQNAAATGGLRGGNTQNSLANFGSQLLAGVIQNQMAGLSGLSAMGANAAGGLASVGQNYANAQNQITQQGANAASNNALLQGNLFQQGLGGLTGLAQQYLLSKSASPVAQLGSANQPYTGGFQLLQAGVPGLGGQYNGNGLGLAPGSYTGGF